jgi:ABC-type lipoprotein export system ATPase subunit
VVTHNLELASMTDRIIHLRDGMVVREVEVKVS